MVSEFIHFYGALHHKEAHTFYRAHPSHQIPEAFIETTKLQPPPQFFSRLNRFVRYPITWQVWSVPSCHCHAAMAIR